jgi:YesN/AraC family two-component response regulator
MKLLIVDDSELLRERIKDLFKDISELDIVGEAINGIEALSMINKTNPDFVLMDIRMPELNGISVLKKMKENGNKAIVCILTNYPYSQYKKKCREEGADYFFDKNTDLVEVKNLILKLASSSKSETNE